MFKAMRWTLPAVGIACVAMLAVVGCGEFEAHPGWDEPLDPEGPYEMEEGVVFLDRAFNDLMVMRSTLDDGEPQLELDRHELGEAPGEPAVSEDGSELYVVNRGELPGEETLSIFEVDEEGVEETTVPLDNLYDEITVDPEGEFILLAYTGQRDTVLQPLNVLGVVDLRGSEPEYRTMTIDRMRVESPEFIDPFEMDGQSERFAVLTATNQVVMVDLDAAEEQRGFRRVYLTTDQTQQVEPTDFVFQPPQADNPGQASLFVLDNHTADVTQVSVQPAIDPDSAHRFDLSINQLAAGDDPQAVEVVELDDAGQRLVALDGRSAQFTMVDVSSGESATFDLSMPHAPTGMKQYSRIDEDGEKPRILVYSTRSPLVEIIRPEVISVGGDSPSLGESVVQILLEAPPSQVHVDDESNRAVLPHDGGDDGFSLLNLEEKRHFAWHGTNFSEVVFDEQTDMAFGLFDASPHIARLDPGGESSREYSLPDVPETLFIAPGDDALVVQHPGDSGRFTAVASDAFDQHGALFEDAVLFEQVFLRDLTGRPAVKDDQ